MGCDDKVLKRIAELLADICRESGLTVISTADLERLENSAHAAKTVETQPPPTRVLVTVQQLCQRTPAFKEQTIRQLLFDRHENGLEKAVRHLGRKLLIDEEQFFDWIDERNGITKPEISRSYGSRQRRYADPTSEHTA